MQLDVPEALAGERVDRAVAFLTGLTRAVVADLVERGAVRLGGKPVKTRSHRVEAGEQLEVDVPEVVVVDVAANDTVPFTVVHEDAAVIVVDKPAGVVVHPGAGVRSATLVNGLLARFPDLRAEPWDDAQRPGIVHRLDKETSGLLAVARTVDAAAALVEQLQTRTMERRYLALAVGVVADDAGTIDAPVGRSTRDRTRMAVAAGGRDARTNYTVVERFADATLIECRLETGRTHQIRVHLAAIGHPVAGDNRYRGRTIHGLRRPFLHAYRLGFDHPSTAERLQFTSALPADLEAVRTAARGER